MTLGSNNKDIQEIEYREIITPRIGGPRNTFNPDLYLFLAIMNQDQGDPRVINPRNSKSRN